MLCSFGLQAILWVLVLRKVPLNQAYPFLSLSYVFDLLASRFLFHEHVSILHIVGIAFIVAGVITISTAYSNNE